MPIKASPNVPVVRINAEALHYTVLHEIERAAKHHTVMHKMIASSTEWSVAADEGQNAKRAQLGRLKQQLDMRIANYIKVIGEGKFSSAIASALEKAEAELETTSRAVGGNRPRVEAVEARSSERK